MKNDLTEGNIFKKLIILAIPIMGTSLMQSAYSMIDMIWVGTLGSRAVTAVGAAGFFTWFAFAFITIPQIGAAVGVAQSVGRKDRIETKNYIRHSIQMNIVFATLYGATLIIFRKELLGFFNIKVDVIVSMASNYLAIVSAGMIFFFLPPVLTAIFNGHGDSRTPFIINILGLIINIILDPLLILGVGPFPKMGVPGAAVATIFAQFIVTIIFIYVITKKTDYFAQIYFLQKPDWNHMRKIIRFGLPVAMQSGV
ncbi:MAG: MATE family efflux transporter, partial [Clostridiaceae bacterium]|nr:MATE family efflux transporter [Clostridiaceae bacterium]